MSSVFPTVEGERDDCRAVDGFAGLGGQAVGLAARFVHDGSCGADGRQR